MRPPEHLDTLRLSLRPPVLEDAGWIFGSYAQDPDVTRYLVWQPHRNIEETLAYLRRCLSAWEGGSAFPWVITRKGDGQPIGMIEIRRDEHKADIGYVLSKAEWGRGYMSEAAEEIVSWALGQSQLYRVWAVCDVENLASARVLEKAGMEREGVLRRWIKHPNVSREPRDCYCYAKVREARLTDLAPEPGERLGA